MSKPTSKIIQITGDKIIHNELYSVDKDMVPTYRPVAKNGFYALCADGSIWIYCIGWQCILEAIDNEK